MVGVGLSGSIRDGWYPRDEMNKTGAGVTEGTLLGTSLATMDGKSLGPADGMLSAAEVGPKTRNKEITPTTTSWS